MADLRTGIQLYTVRQTLKDDFPGTIKALAEMGYDGVEFAWNYGGMTPEELAAFLQEVGLVACGLHAKKDEVDRPDSDAYAYAKALGCPYVTTSLAGDVEAGWDAAMDLVAAAGETAHGLGLTFTYHHHAQEFAKIDGQYALDLLYARTDAVKVQCELDTFWIKRGGEDPVSYIRKYAGRVPQIHLKDMNTEGDFSEIGTGVIDVPGVLDVAKEIGAQWIIYEQDRCAGAEIDSARTSIRNLKSALS